VLRVFQISTSDGQDTHALRSGQVYTGPEVGAKSRTSS
jgi:hypothetical protein